ncbi:FAD-dependent oxidoreductase [Eubacteriales bacterium OttesenSCG-928-A19]|nr:FAD-dependent oxidoreductase [Eubacteriales bacterium OttesenSCG-928-A19]
MANYRKEKQARHSIIVVGGGMTGICAAIAAARHGADVALVQDRAVLGGNASSEIRMHICGASTNMTKDHVEETGIIREIQLENKRHNDYYNYSVWDRVLFQFVKTQPNLTAYLNTTMTDAHAQEGRIQRVECYQMTTETHWTLSADQFIDCTGNGTLGYLCGAEFRTGSEGKDEFGEPHAPEKANNDHMGNTLLFKAIDRGVPVRFEKPDWAYTFTEEQLVYRKHADGKPLYGIDEAQGTLPLYDAMQEDAKSLSFDAYCVDYGYWWIELPAKGGDIIDEYEEIRDELVKCVYGVWDHIKNGGDHGAENYDLQWVGMLPGVRESRRLVGDYILTENDILANRVFDDAVAYGGWPIDNHTPGGLMDFDKLPSFIYTFPGVYSIPYRCYYSKNIDNLFIAGRIMSASKLAMASSRVMATCAVGGQAVGTAAYLCARDGCDPRALLPRIGELQQLLMRDDCYLPGFRNEDPEDLLRAARVTASSETENGRAEQVQNGYARVIDGATNRWESSGISPQGETLRFDLDAPREVSSVRLVFDPNLSRSVKITLSSKRMQQQLIGTPPELVKDYAVTLLLDGKPVRVLERAENYQRLNVLSFEKTLCDSIELTVRSTNGYPNALVFEMGAY